MSPVVEIGILNVTVNGNIRAEEHDEHGCLYISDPRAYLTLRAFDEAKGQIMIKPNGGSVNNSQEAVAFPLREGLRVYLVDPCYRRQTD